MSNKDEAPIEKLQAPSHNPNRKMLFCYRSHAQREDRDGFSSDFDSYTFYDDLTCERMSGSESAFEDYPGGSSETENTFYGTWKVVVCDEDKSKKKIIIDECDVYHHKSASSPGFKKTDELKKRDKDKITVQEFPLDDDHLHRESSKKFGGRVQVEYETVYTYKLEGDAQKFLEFCQKQVA